MTNDATLTTIAALIHQIQADAAMAQHAAAKAAAAVDTGNRNGAIGALLMAEAEIGRLSSLLATTLTLHRAG